MAGLHEAKERFHHPRDASSFLRGSAQWTVHMFGASLSSVFEIMKHLSLKYHLKQQCGDWSSKNDSGNICQTAFPQKSGAQNTRTPIPLTNVVWMHPYVFLPVCGAGLVEIERTFPWSSYRSRGPRGSAVCPLRWCRLEPHSNSQYQGLLGSLGTPVYNHLPISTTQEHFWGPALFLPPPWGSLSHGPWGGPLAALFQLWDEVAPPPGEMLLLWGSTTFQNPFCSRSCSGQLSVFLGCWIFWLPLLDHGSAWPPHRMVWDVLWS